MAVWCRCWPLLTKVLKSICASPACVKLHPGVSDWGNAAWICGIQAQTSGLLQGCIFPLFTIFCTFLTMLSRAEAGRKQGGLCSAFAEAWRIMNWRRGAPCGDYLIFQRTPTFWSHAKSGHVRPLVRPPARPPPRNAKLKTSLAANHREVRNVGKIIGPRVPRSAKSLENSLDTEGSAKAQSEMFIYRGE